MRLGRAVMHACVLLSVKVNDKAHGSYLDQRKLRGTFVSRAFYHKTI